MKAALLLAESLEEESAPQGGSTHASEAVSACAIAALRCDARARTAEDARVTERRRGARVVASVSSLFHRSTVQVQIDNLILSYPGQYGSDM